MVEVAGAFWPGRFSGSLRQRSWRSWCCFGGSGYEILVDERRERRIGFGWGGGGGVSRGGEVGREVIVFSSDGCSGLVGFGHRSL